MDPPSSQPPPANPPPPSSRSAYLESAEFRDACDAIAAALSEAREQHHFESDELRASVVRCARDARRAGVPPEHLLVALKTIVRESAIADVRDWFRAVVTDRIVVWAVEAYYGIDDGDAEGTASR